MADSSSHSKNKTTGSQSVFARLQALFPNGHSTPTVDKSSGSQGIHDDREEAVTKAGPAGTSSARPHARPRPHSYSHTHAHSHSPSKGHANETLQPDSDARPTRLHAVQEHLPHSRARSRSRSRSRTQTRPSPKFLKMRILTWNMHDSLPKGDLTELLGEIPSELKKWSESGMDDEEGSSQMTGDEEEEEGVEGEDGNDDDESDIDEQDETTSDEEEVKVIDDTGTLTKTRGQGDRGNGHFHRPKRKCVDESSESSSEELESSGEGSEDEDSSEAPVEWPEFPFDAKYPWHILVVAGQECPSTLGIPMGIGAGGLGTGFRLRAEEKEKEKERERDRDKDKDKDKDREKKLKKDKDRHAGEDKEKGQENATGKNRDKEGNHDKRTDIEGGQDLGRHIHKSSLSAVTGPTTPSMAIPAGATANDLPGGTPRKSSTTRIHELMKSPSPFLSSSPSQSQSREMSTSLSQSSTAPTRPGSHNLPMRSKSQARINTVSPETVPSGQHSRSQTSEQSGSQIRRYDHVHSRTKSMDELALTGGRGSRSRSQSHSHHNWLHHHHSYHRGRLRRPSHRRPGHGAPDEGHDHHEHIHGHSERTHGWTSMLEDWYCRGGGGRRDESEELFSDNVKGERDQGNHDGEKARDDAACVQKDEPKGEASIIGIADGDGIDHGFVSGKDNNDLSLEEEHGKSVHAEHLVSNSVFSSQTRDSSGSHIDGRQPSKSPALSAGQENHQSFIYSQDDSPECLPGATAEDDSNLWSRLVGNDGSLIFGLDVDLDMERQRTLRPGELEGQNNKNLDQLKMQEMDSQGISDDRTEAQSAAETGRYEHGDEDVADTSVKRKRAIASHVPSSRPSSRIGKGIERQAHTAPPHLTHTHTRLRNRAGSSYGPSYVGPYLPLVKERMMGLYLAVYVHRDVKGFVKGTSKSAVTAGLIGGRVGNKGGVGISLNLGGTTMLLVNAHLAAHEGKVQHRLADLAKIKKAELAVDDWLKPDDPRVMCEDITDKFDFTFLCGDLNFRLDISRLHADWLISRQDYPQALGFDQLRQQMAEGTAFSGFNEATITFPPTFKYDVSRSRSLRRRKSKGNHQKATDGNSKRWKDKLIEKRRRKSMKEERGIEHLAAEDVDDDEHETGDAHEYEQGQDGDRYSSVYGDAASVASSIWTSIPSSRAVNMTSTDAEDDSDYFTSQSISSFISGSGGQGISVGHHRISLSGAALKAKNKWKSLLSPVLTPGGGIRATSPGFSTTASPGFGGSSSGGVRAASPNPVRCSPGPSRSGPALGIAASSPNPKSASPVPDTSLLTANVVSPSGFVRLGGHTPHLPHSIQSKIMKVKQVLGESSTSLGNSSGVGRLKEIGERWKEESQRAMVKEIPVTGPGSIPVNLPRKIGESVDGHASQQQDSAISSHVGSPPFFVDANQHESFSTMPSPAMHAVSRAPSIAKSQFSARKSEDIEEGNEKGVYDSSHKQRVPSWCDRILWKSTVKQECDDENGEDVEELPEKSKPRMKVSHLFNMGLRSLSGRAGKESASSSRQDSPLIDSAQPSPSSPGKELAAETSLVGAGRSRSISLQERDIEQAALMNAFSPSKKPLDPTPKDSAVINLLPRRSFSEVLSVTRPRSLDLSPVARPLLSSSLAHGQVVDANGQTMSTPLATPPLVAKDNSTTLSFSSRWRFFPFRRESQMIAAEDQPLTPDEEQPVTVPAKPKRGDVVCLDYNTLDDHAMRLLEGRSDHRPVIGQYVIYI